MESLVVGGLHAVFKGEVNVLVFLQFDAALD